jgi:hypothetical protein
MKLKIASAALMLAALSLPAFAADEFYVVQDVKDEEVHNRRQEADGHVRDRRQPVGHDLQVAHRSRERHEDRQGLHVKLRRTTNASPHFVGRAGCVGDRWRHLFDWSHPLGL